MAAPERIAEAELLCAFALAEGKTLMREGVSSLAALRETLTAAQRVVLLLGPGDVTVLQVAVPPLSAKRLRTALPNLLEDRLLSDPNELISVVGAEEDGGRPVAVAQRAGLEALLARLQSLGARAVSAFAWQHCLPLPAAPDQCSASVNMSGAEIALTMRRHGQAGVGVCLHTTALDLLPLLPTLAPDSHINLHLAADQMVVFQSALAQQPAALQALISCQKQEWAGLLDTTLAPALNLLAGLSRNSDSTLAWQAWRWPLGLLGLLLVCQISALQIDWWQARREAAGLQMTMVQSFKALYPRETVLEPVAQMRQKIGSAQAAAGQLAADDGLVLLAQFTAAWNLAASGVPASAALASLEYKERGLLIYPRAGISLPVAALKQALAQRQLSFSEAGQDARNQQNTAGWIIRKSK